MKRRILAVILVIALVAMTGCGNQGGEGSDEVNKHQIIIANEFENVSGFDPISGWGRSHNPLFQSKLVVTDGDRGIKGDLAQDYKANENSTVWTFKLREDAYFSDGEQLTAEDVVFTVETCKQAATTVDMSIVEKAEATDDFTVVMSLKEPDSTFIYRITNLAIIPAHAYDASTYTDNPIGSGPYMMEQWDKGQQLILVPNPYYYGGEPNITRVVMLQKTHEAALTAVKSGEVDVAYADMVTATTEVEGYDLLSLSSVDNLGVLYPIQTPQGKDKDGEEVGNAVTSDIAIRKAFSYAIDRDYYANTIANGFAKPSYSITTGSSVFNEETIITDTSVEKGKQILEDAGWVDTDGDGIREKDGVVAEFELYYPSTEEMRQMIAYAFADLGKDLGVDVKPVGASWDKIYTKWHSVPHVSANGSISPEILYTSIHSRGAGVGMSNPGVYKNTTVDKYMDEAKATADLDEATKLWKKSQWDGETGSSMLGDCPVTWIMNKNHMYFIRDGLNVGEQDVQAHESSGIQILNDVVNWSWE